MKLTPNPTRFKLGMFCQYAGTGAITDPMGVNPKLSPTPEVGHWHQGYRKRWIDAALPSMRDGDRIILHCIHGQRIEAGQKLPYFATDRYAANYRATHLADLGDISGAYRDLPNLINYMGAIRADDPCFADMPDPVNRVRLVMDAVNSLPPGPVCFDRSASLGTDGDPAAGVAASVYRSVAFNQQRGLLVEPWVQSVALQATRVSGIVATTAEIDRWEEDSSRWPREFALEHDTTLPVYVFINHVPRNLDKIENMFDSACALALRGLQPMIGMEDYPTVAGLFNSYFSR